MIAAIVLAAGRSARMGRNKLLIDWDGKPLVAHAADAALDAGLAPVVVVTGFEAERVRAALAGRPIAFAHNPAFAAGMAGSLRTGLAALPDTAAGVLVCLGDMPRVRAAHMARIAADFAPGTGPWIHVPVHAGRRGNPVLLARALFADLMALEGDRGARGLIAANPGRTREVAMADDAVLIDLDTAEALAALGAEERT